MTFEFEVRVGTRSGGHPNFLGAFAQGPPAGRFVYINSGTLAGQADSVWTRRAKVPLAGITWAMIERARAAGSMLETEIERTARDGGPVCATVPLLSGGWRMAAEPRDGSLRFTSSSEDLKRIAHVADRQSCCTGAADDGTTSSTGVSRTTGSDR
jgi:hypothetical protein